MNIVLAIDGSPQSLAAAKFLAKLPHRQRLHVHAVTVMNVPQATPSATRDLWYPRYLEQQEEFARHRFQEIQAIFEGADATVHEHRVNGHVGQAIVECAEATRANLIVMGALGHSLISRMLLGSVSDYVATHAACSVLIVRPDILLQDHGLRVTIGYDGSPPSHIALQQFGEFYWQNHVQVQVVSVDYQIPIVAEGIFPLTMEEAASAYQEAYALAEFAARKLTEQKVPAVPKAVQGQHVGQALVDAASEFSSAVILLGDTGQSAVGRMLLGSVSRFVLRHAPQSVWIARRACIEPPVTRSQRRVEGKPALL